MKTKTILHDLKAPMDAIPMDDGTAPNMSPGLLAGPGMTPPYVVTGVAVDADGSIYYRADRINGMYRIRPGR